MNRALLALVLVPALAACVPTILTPEQQSQWSATLTEQALRNAYSHQPRLQWSCVGEDGVTTGAIRRGANTCAVLVIPASGATDFSRVDYVIQTHYLVPIGTLLNPKYTNGHSNVQRSFSTISNGKGFGALPYSFPDDPLKGITKAAVHAAVANTIPAAKALITYFGLPIVSNWDLSAAIDLEAEMETALVAAFSSKNKLESIVIGVRACGAKYCSPWATEKVPNPFTKD